jgi:hypothetical protein
MRLPTVTFQVSVSGSGLTADLRWCTAFERSMKTVVVEIILERFKLSLQINRVPEQRLVKKLTTNGPNQTLNKRTGNGCVRNTFNGFNF